MESIIEVVVGIGPRLAKCIFHIMESHYTSKVANLRDQVGELNNAIRNMRDRADEAKGNGEVIMDGVQRWLESATEISRRAEDFPNVNRDRANVSCCNVQIPNLVSRRKLSREAKQMVEDLQREIQAAQGFNVVAARPALQTVIAMRGDYEDFGSRKTILEDIMKALQDRNVSRIGIYGIGGIGKTTLAKEVARQVEKAKLFTEVAITTVSRPPDFSRMQREIAEKIGLDFRGLESIPARADRLQRRLKEEKSILIILDDIWEKLDLIEVGIHLENEGCKMLMTSRDRDVLGFMGTNQNIRVDDLQDDEAMNLFKKIVGDIVEKTDFMRLATDVVRECGRLPLAITTVAYALKSRDDLSVWTDALMQLQNSAPTNIDVALKNFYPSIKLSYEFLRSAEEKSLLLLCSLFGEDRDITVEDLIMCSVGLDLFPNVHTLAHLRIRVKSLIVRLKACCLLLDGDRGDGVKMHDVIRDVALSIASGEGGMHSVVLKKKEDCRNLKMKKLKDSKVLSLLPYSNFDQLPERLECSELELFLLLSDQRKCIPIPNHLLDESKDRLRSLFFEQANLVSVPPSFHSLQNLQTLRLRGCVLEDVNFIGDLKNLQILDLSVSTIKQLPIKVGNLSRLQLLNLKGCRDLKLIEPKVISNLIQLEELYISEYFDKWEVGEVDVSRKSNVNLAEIENLPQLTSVSLRVPDAKTFPKDFKFSEKLERYRILIGDPLGYLDSTGISRSLLLNLHERSQLTALGLESLMKRSEGLLLDGLIDVKNVVYDLDREGFCDLKRLHLRHSDGVQYIVDCVDQQIHPHKAFPVLEILRLSGLRNLERICHGKLPEDSFKNLRQVTVWRCDKLKNVFPLSIFKRLHSVDVSDCEMMEEIVGHVRSEDDGAVEFPELRSLHLRNLPKMVRFMSWSEAEAAGGSSSVESPEPLFGEKVI
ncbi:hypothetical protein TIFTF001_050048 [Ficus carica]|uniref:AAA+ ATPase domain-containing protein n=1 Tax=Ficus carica TaxID=3494 RepID=A0AA88CJY1_FICCA|nr:hypothetical protein TIFTF001_050038 [Ficus carica]GMN20545.1 hypothetical protein TIFTF001_050048 [Ficus carica]